MVFIECDKWERIKKKSQGTRWERSKKCKGEAR